MNILKKLRNHKSVEWQDFYSRGYVLDALLQGRAWEGVGGGVESLFFNGSFPQAFQEVMGDLVFEETLPTASAVAHSSMCSYLWGSEGRNIVLGYPEGNALSGRTASDVSALEKKLQTAVSNSRDLNKAIRCALKHCLDFGAGYVSSVDGVFECIHPLRVTFGRVPNNANEFHLVEDAYGFWFFGKEESLDYVKGDANPKPVKESEKYVAAHFTYDWKHGDDDSSVEDTRKTSDLPMFHRLDLPFFENRVGVPVGCGNVALAAALKLRDSLDAAVFAQLNAMNPAILANTDVSRSLDCLSPGDKITFSPMDTRGAPPIMNAIQTDAANSPSYSEFWRSSIRRAYLLDSLVAAGVGQTTAADASRNSAAVSSLYSQMVTPFHRWFVTPLIYTFIKYEMKGVFTKTDLDELEIRFVGSFTADLLNRDLQSANVIAQTLQLAVQFDPTATQVVNFGNVLRGALEDSSPAKFYYSERETAARVEQMQRQQAAAAAAAAAQKGR